MLLSYPRYVLGQLFILINFLGFLHETDLVSLFPVLRKIVRHENGHARRLVGDGYEKMTFEELCPYWFDMKWAIENPAPTGIIANHRIRLAGLEIFRPSWISAGL